MLVLGVFVGRVDTKCIQYFGMKTTSTFYQSLVFCSGFTTKFFSPSACMHHVLIDRDVECKTKFLYCIYILVWAGIAQSV